MGINILEEFHNQKVDLKTSHWERQRSDTIELYLSIPDGFGITYIIDWNNDTYDNKAY